MDRKMVDRKIDRFIAEMQDAIEQAVKSEMLAWSKKYPKRKLHFYDIMGAINITVSSPRWQGDYHVMDHFADDDLRTPILMPLRDILAWYIEVSDRLKLSINEIKIG